MVLILPAFGLKLESTEHRALYIVIYELKRISLVNDSNHFSSPNTNFVRRLLNLEAYTLNESMRFNLYVNPTLWTPCLQWPFRVTLDIKRISEKTIWYFEVQQKSNKRKRGEQKWVVRPVRMRETEKHGAHIYIRNYSEEFTP